MFALSDCEWRWQMFMVQKETCPVIVLKSFQVWHRWSRRVETIEIRRLGHKDSWNVQSELPQGRLPAGLWKGDCLGFLLNPICRVRLHMADQGTLRRKEYNSWSLKRPRGLQVIALPWHPRENLESLFLTSANKAFNQHLNIKIFYKEMNWQL